MRTLILLAVAFWGWNAQAKVYLPQVFSDHMVLQLDLPIQVWGWAEAKERITVRFAGQEAKTRARRDGRWKVLLPALPASAEGRPLSVEGENEILLENVRVGDVWLCGGQSNMAWAASGIWTKCTSMASGWP
ncbi:MAG: hypothetical protein D6722_13270 [Bacteroidetes bacterium]|nr:MAG: hypothetical protein D6722_13270 [Bacteroidota bacterium]